MSPYDLAGITEEEWAEFNAIKNTSFPIQVAIDVGMKNGVFKMPGDEFMTPEDVFEDSKYPNDLIKAVASKRKTAGRRLVLALTKEVLKEKGQADPDASS